MPFNIFRRKYRTYLLLQEYLKHASDRSILRAPYEKLKMEINKLDNDTFDSYVYAYYYEKHHGNFSPYDSEISQTA